jgi:tetratricopeptide (TPR) repeat protein
VSNSAESFAYRCIEHGMALAQQGRLDEAAAAFHQALQWQPGCADALNNLGTIRSSQGLFAEALACYEEALRHNPAHASAHYNRALALEQIGRLDDAAESYERALAIAPGYVDAWNNLGNVRKRLGDPAGAAAAYRQALYYQPDYVLAHNNLGNILVDLGLLDEAVASYRKALDLQPSWTEAYDNLGNALARLGRLEDAMTCYREAIHLAPALVEAHNNLGALLARRGLLDGAIACYQQAVRLKPDYAEAHNNLGAVFAQQERLAEAVISYQQALQIKPDYAEAIHNLAIAFTTQGRFDEAAAHYQQVIRLKPDYAAAHKNLGSALAELGSYAEALASYRQALRLDPDYADAHCSLGLLLLLQGDYERGWPEYEWRGRLCEPRSFPAPRWDGTPLAGRTILLHSEQGLGDTIQFLRYAPLVKQHGGTVIVVCQPQLLPLAATCPGIDYLVTDGAPLPAFDVHAPLLSLPAILGTTLATIPAAVPYLRAQPELIDQWRTKLRAHDTYKIGIAWQGNPTFGQDRQRSIPLAAFAPLAQLPGVKLISLQKGHGREQLRNLKGAFPVLDLGDQVDEAVGPFMDTAAIMRNLDLVIAPNTVLAHLAGALAIPVWVALPAVPEWRWLLDRSDSPWYPSARLFRQQQAGDWHRVFQQLALEVHAIVMARSHS